VEGGAVETLSSLVSHVNPTVQLNALWGLMVRWGRGEGRRGLHGGMGQGGRRIGREGEGKEEVNCITPFWMRFVTGLGVFPIKDGWCNSSLIFGMCFK